MAKYEKSQIFSGADKYDSNGRLKVDPNLLLEGYDNVYAAGDCNNVLQEKMAPHAGDHGELVVANIVHQIKGESLQKYVPRKANYEYNKIG